MSHLLTLFFVPPAYALEDRFVILKTGFGLTLNQIMANIISFLAVSIVGLALVLFLIGAFLLIFANLTHNEDLLGKGKNAMKRSLIGMAIVLGSYAIVRTIVYLLY